MEFPELGTHCSHKGCNQLDFLPAPCSHCRQPFCVDHLSPFVHSCQEFRDNVLTDAELEGREKERWSLPCNQQTCKARDVLPMKCPKCGIHYCLAHRFPDQHGCAVVAKEVAERREESRKLKEVVEARKEMQAKVRQDVTDRLEEAKGAGGAKGKMAAKLALMKLKGRAKGDPAVPQTERVFLAVECPNKEQNPNGLDVWLSKEWSMGKAIDFLAHQARIKNKNNVKDAPKLHIFKGEECLSKPSERKIKELMESGLLEDGDALQFRLIEADAET